MPAPNPKSCSIDTDDVANAKNDTASSAAAEVTMRPVCAVPSITASGRGLPPWNISVIRLDRNTS